MTSHEKKDTYSTRDPEFAFDKRIKVIHEFVFTFSYLTLVIQRSVRFLRLKLFQKIDLSFITVDVDF